MFKMSDTSLPIFLNANKRQSNDVEQISLSLSDVLQSGPVKRLLDRPNITVKTIPTNTQSRSSFTSNITNANVMNISMNSFEDKNNDIVGKELNKKEHSEPFILSYKLSKKENIDDENLLPSKTEGKSEIALLPIERKNKDCGHYEPCENIICDVTIKQCIDQNGISPLLAYDIEEHEINAPVWKHCKSNCCDALSIDHDRCRRAIIKLTRFDISRICDICGITLKTRKSRIYHKHCKRQNEYRHNMTNSAQLLKERMRERELQMLEDAKIKKQDYMDPITGYNRAIDTLRKNEELIIIPKTRSPQYSVLTIASTSNNQVNQQLINNTNFSAKYLPSVPFILSPQSIIFDKDTNYNETNATPIAQTESHCTTNNKPFTNTSTTAIPNQSNTSQTSIQSIPLNNWLLSQSHVIATSLLRSKPILTPIRVVPITNLITQPSLLHQTQGIPKFCIMTDNPMSPLTMQDIQPTVSSKPVNSLNISQEEKHRQELPKRQRGGIKKNLGKRIRKKDLKCNYCSKHFSTDLYFKIHVAMHSGEKPFSYTICQESFANRYDMEKHVINNQKNDSINCDYCDFTCTSYALLDEHIKIHSTMEKLHKCTDHIETATAITETKSKCNRESTKLYVIQKKNRDYKNNPCTKIKGKCINGKITRKRKC